MRVVVQRVKRASVSVDGEIVGNIKEGLFVLLGVGEDDTEKQVGALADKVAKLRILSDNDDKMNLSVMDKKAQILVVSQFTLYANTKKGNRPSFVNAAKPKKAKKLYEYFVESLRQKGVKVETGEFGAMMTIDTQLDGPVTINLKS